MSYRLLKFLLALFLIILPLTSNGADTSTKTARWYKIYWNKIYIADLKVELDDNAMAASIESYGTVKKISNYSSYTLTKFHMVDNQYLPLYFESDLTQRQGAKHAIINYSDDGKIAKETTIPPENRAKRPAVADSLKVGAADPLTAALRVKQQIRAGITKGIKKFSLNIYDGRRLARLDFNIEGNENIKVLDKMQNVLKISFKRTALEGFTKNELKRMKGEEPDFSVYLDPITLMPVKADAAAPLGKAQFILVRECESIDNCK